MLHSDFASINTDYLPKGYTLGDIPSSLTKFDTSIARKLLHSAYGNSPYLYKLLHDYPEQLEDFFNNGADESFANLECQFSNATNENDIMKALRHYKHQAAMIIALADISGIWSLEKVTNALSEVATKTLQASLNYLIKEYQNKHGLVIAHPEDGSGIIVLAMGKLGAGELNYSSDVDLILLFEADKLSLNNEKPLQQTLNKLAQDFIRVMNDRTPDGYVFRMDLRLRPDPASTPLIINTETAFRYYESVGQNWERAAFIKATPVAGDIDAGVRFLDEIKPFIWRKSLDFAAIDDIKSIKRQMDKQFDNISIEIAGYDVKKGMGGIREIEFLAQIHQLIWGGRTPELRAKQTLKAYETINNMQLLSKKEVSTLKHNYKKLRMIEHRIQMVRDEQTHIVPKSIEDRERIAYFCGYSGIDEFESSLTKIAAETHDIYINAFNDGTSLAGDGKLSFIGVSQDNDTIKTLNNMGFKDPEAIWHNIQSWHRGSVSAMRSSRAREILTELTPTLLQEISEQPDADAAFRRFARFFSKLPSGVMLLSLLHNNPQILHILINIIGNAPLLADHLSKHPDWLDALLSLGNDNEKTIDSKSLASPEHYQKMSSQPEETASWLCRYRSEHEFIIGCQILKGISNPQNAMPTLTHIANTAIEELSVNIINEFEEKYGTIDNSEFSIIALGRLGSNELTFGSDLDLLFLYNTSDEFAESNGNRKLGVASYYNRLTQRIIGQLSAMTPEGRLYEIDSRLRPAGEDGPVAVSLKALQKYYDKSAWTFEHMALMRNRLVFAYPNSNKAPEIIKEILQQHIDPEIIKKDALDMRSRLWREFPSNDGWDIKHAKGGLIDITFIAQVIALQNSQKHPELLKASAIESLETASKIGLIDKQHLQTIANSLDFQQNIQAILRLCYHKQKKRSLPKGLQNILMRSLEINSFSKLEQSLIEHQQASYTIFKEIIGDYA